MGWLSRSHRAASSAAVLLASMVLMERPPPRMPGNRYERMPSTKRCPDHDKKLMPVPNKDRVLSCPECGKRFHDDTRAT